MFISHRVELGFVFNDYSAKFDLSCFFFRSWKKGKYVELEPTKRAHAIHPIIATVQME